MKTIDERLAEVLTFLCEKNEVNPVDLSSKGKLKVFLENKDEIDQLRETINYLKDYAKMKAVAQSIGDTEGLSKNIDETISSLEKKIEDANNKFSSIPSKKRVKVPNENLFGFEAEIAAKKIKDIEAYNAGIDAQKQSIKSDIQDMKGKIKELKSMKKDLGSPNRIIKRFFSDESYEQTSNYARLINICAASITDGFNSEELIGEDKVFTYDPETKQYSVNKKNARKFISTVKKKKDIISAVEYIKAKKACFGNSEKYKETMDKISLYQKAIDISSTEDFKYVHESINEIIRDYNDLQKSEFYDYEGNPVKRVFRTVVDIMGLHGLANRPSRKVRRKRVDLERKIRGFLQDVNSDPSMKETYQTYVNSRSAILGQGELSINDLIMASQNLTQGFGRFELPRHTIKLDSMIIELENVKKGLTEKAVALEKEKDASNEQAEKMLADLPAGTLKILGDYSEGAILDMAKNYYNISTDGRINRIGKKVLSGSAAIMILEGILSRKNISFDTICDSYAGILGQNGINAEKMDLSRLMEEKVASLYDRINSLGKSKEEQAKRTENSVDSEPEVVEI